MKSNLVNAHRLLAILLGLFIISHILVHLTAVAGPQTHMLALGSVQGIYRNVVVEPILVLAIIAQIAVGARLVWRRIRLPGKGFWGWAQIVSGLYIATFLVIHSSAALVTRYQVGLDTNFYWAAGTLLNGDLPYFFAPYYFFAVLSVFTHLGAALHFGWADKGAKVAPVLVATGAVIGTIIVASFGGALYEIDQPAEYRQYFSDMVAQ